jgi:hypothetical protein
MKPSGFCMAVPSVAAWSISQASLAELHFSTGEDCHAEFGRLFV